MWCYFHDNDVKYDVSLVILVLLKSEIIFAAFRNISHIPFLSAYLVKFREFDVITHLADELISVIVSIV